MVGDKVIITDGRHKGADFGAASPSYHVILENDDVVTVRRVHVKAH